MVDGRSAASVVAVDPERAAKERDAAARAMLSEGTGKGSGGMQQFLKKGLVLTVPYTLKIVVSDPDEMEKAKTTAESVLASGFQLVDTVLNNYNPSSEVSLINELPVGQTHQMSGLLKRVMGCCQRVFNSSRGAMDPAAAPLIKLLREAARTGTPAPAERVNALANICTLSKSFEINLQKGTITRKHKNAALDLGAVNKGYTVDYVVEQLNQAGLNNVFFEWGGDVRASGVNPAGKLWTVGISRPPGLAELPNFPENRSFIRVVQLDNEAIATSGDYENLIVSPNGSLYTSIYRSDKRALMQPSETNLSQVSVKCYSCMYADALSTAALLKSNPTQVRYFLDGWRYVRDTVTDYTAYTRADESVARMFEIAIENAEMRAKRIAGSLPARVIVIGGGLAGCAAAIEAANCGAQVILLEKESKLGGNSAKATSGINGWGTRAQAKQGVIDGGKYFERDTYRSGRGGNCDPGLVRMLSVKSADAIKWLTDFGIPLTVLSQLGGASRKRCHRAPDKGDGTPVPIGYTIMRTLENHIRTHYADKITLLTNSAACELMHQDIETLDGNKEIRVQGVRYKNLSMDDSPTMELHADAVILATGGFSNDHTDQSLLREYAPKLFTTPTTNGTWATGDGVKMARELGATLVDMDKVQLHPTGLIDPKDPANRTKYLGPEALRGSGGVLINKSGERFVNELDLRSVVSQAIIAQNNEYPGSNGSKFAYCVLNEEAAELFGRNTLNYYWKAQGLFTRVEDVKELAKLIGCSEETLTNTLTSYEANSRSKAVCMTTGKNVFPCVLGPQGPFYVAFVTPSIHYTMGGCLISPSAEVLRKFKALHLSQTNRPIYGLFGAGEVTGGVHGQNRLGGNSLLECVVFGRIAGDRAATILQKRNTALSQSEWTPVVVREVRSGDQFGVGSRVLRFNLPGALQKTGLALGQFIGIRGEWDGQQMIGYYSPITLPDDKGRISILARNRTGNLREWISALQPGDAVDMKACGGLRIDLVPEKRQILYKRAVIRKFAMIAGGSGIAPMLQIIRALLFKPYVENFDSIRLLYAADDENELTYRDLLQKYSSTNSEKFFCEFVLNNPPEGWTGGVGYLNKDYLRNMLQPPSNDLLVAICGPPVMQRNVRDDLISLGYDPRLVRTVDENMTP